MAISTLNKLLGQKYLRQGDGIIATPASRRTERLFGKFGSGRTKPKSLGKLENLGSDYQPREDSCIKAFVCLLAEDALADAAAP